jgi:hypothetical protein
MEQDDLERIVQEYLLYLAHIRVPETIPNAPAEVEAMIEEQDRRSKSNPYRDAWEAVDELIRSDPEVAWTVLLESIDRCHLRDLGMIGAGALETFMWHQGVKFLDRVLAAIRTNSKFRDAFSGVYLGADFPEQQGRLINATLIACGLPQESTIDWWRAPQDG